MRRDTQQNWGTDDVLQTAIIPIPDAGSIWTNVEIRRTSQTFLSEKLPNWTNITTFAAGKDDVTLAPSRHSILTTEVSLSGHTAKIIWEWRKQLDECR